MSLLTYENRVRNKSSSNRSDWKYKALYLCHFADLTPRIVSAIVRLTMHIPLVEYYFSDLTLVRLPIVLTQLVCFKWKLLSS